MLPVLFVLVCGRDEFWTRFGRELRSSGHVICQLAMDWQGLHARHAQYKHQQGRKGQKKTMGDYSNRSLPRHLQHFGGWRSIPACMYRVLCNLPELPRITVRLNDPETPHSALVQRDYADNREANREV